MIEFVIANRLQVETKVSTSIGSNALHILKSFIQSWFTTLETNLEYQYSRELFSHILKSTIKDVGEHAVLAVEDLVKILDLKKKYLYHYNFVGKTTLGFKGDSIVEASFSATKRKRNQISTRKTIDKSAMHIVTDSMERTKHKNNQLQQQMEREVCWSRANVRNDITKYSLGLFCKNFDKKKNYHTVRVGEFEWLSLHIEEFEKKNSKMEAPSFKRVRTITLDKEGFLNCSCGKTGEYLLPCKHICSVVNEDKYFSLESIHIRWHKQFGLLHGNSFGKENSPEQTKLINELLEITRKTHYHPNGMYKGVPMKGTAFVKSLPEFKDRVEIDEKMKFMLHVKKNSKKKPITSTSTCLRTFGTENRSEMDTSTCDLLGDFSLLSQEEFQECESLFPLSNKKCHKDDERSPYHQTNDGFEKALDMATNQDDIDEINMFFTNFVNKRIASRKRHSQSVGDTVLFGENLKKGTKIEQRHKFFYETI